MGPGIGPAHHHGMGGPGMGPCMGGPHHGMGGPGMGMGPGMGYY